MHKCLTDGGINIPSDAGVDLIEAQYVDSYTVIEIVDLLEQRFGVAFAPADLSLDNLTTLKAMTDTVQRLRTRSA